LEITLDDLVISEAMLLALEKDSMRVFSNVGLTQDSRGQSELMEVMRRVGEGNKREVYRHLQKHLSWVQFEKAIDGCVKAGDIQQIKMGNETFLQVRDAKSRPIVGSD
jgi:hypothetical protein